MISVMQLILTLTITKTMCGENKRNIALCEVSSICIWIYPSTSRKKHIGVVPKKAFSFGISPLVYITGGVPATMPLVTKYQRRGRYHDTDRFYTGGVPPHLHTANYFSEIKKKLLPLLTLAPILTTISRSSTNNKLKHQQQ
jgi:hypothetical protein